MIGDKKKNLFYCVLTGVIAAAVILALQIIIGQPFFKPQPYNSYILQAKAWLGGHLDLGQDYPYLELAIYEGKYFVSFPPFPSYLMLPFTALGWEWCDGFIAYASAILGAVYSYRISNEYISKKPISILLALAVTVGSNWLFTSVNAWVWFIAQNLAFTLTVMSFYYAIKGRAGLSLALWACAVGCRPFQVIYIFIILFLLYQTYKKTQTLGYMIKSHIISVIPMLCIAVSYMLLNFARFGNIAEFGHNYLPEFTRTSTGQFNVEYLKNNFVNLFRLPEFQDGKIVFQSADGFCMFIASPILISYFVSWTVGIIKDKDRLIYIASMLLFWVHIVMTAMHKTMGGSHYGNRYVTDTLCAAFVLMCTVYKRHNKYVWLNAVPFVAGVALNIYWILLYY